MNFDDLLGKKSIDPRNVLVLRHRPHEPELNKVLPWIAAERHDLYNAYQQCQGAKLEAVMHRMSGNGYIASFIGREAGTALFMGLYSISGCKPLTYSQFWRLPAHIELKSFGMRGRTEENKERVGLLFQLSVVDFCSDWKGKLIIGWPPPERSWWRRAHRNVFPVRAILQESALDAAMPEWDAINLKWEELGILPTRWKSRLSEWRGIYYIHDSSDGKGYVGSAYGKENVLQRWKRYAERGHGDNKLLWQRVPTNFRFTILQRVSPDLDVRDVIRLETSWKDRLHTRAPSGLNDN